MINSCLSNNKSHFNLFMDNKNLRTEYHNYSGAYTLSVLAQGKKKPPGQVAGGFWKKQT